MQSPIDQTSLQQILESAEEDALAQLIEQFNLTTQTVVMLKDYSAAFYFSDPVRAVQIAKQAYQLSTYLPKPALAFGSWALGNAYLHNAQYTEAERQFAQARAVFLASGNPLDAARLGVGHVGVLAYVGKLQDALALASQIEPILTKSSQTNQSDLRRLAALPTNIGIIYELLGEYEEALSVYERYLHVLESLGDHHLLARAHHNRAYAFAQVGAITEAIETYAYAEDLLRTVEAKVDLVRLYMNRGQLMLLLGKAEEMLANLQNAQQLLATLPEMAATAHHLSMLRAQFALVTDTDWAHETLSELASAQVFFKENGPVLEEGLAWLLLGKYYLKQKATPSAQHCFQQAMALVDEGANRSLAHQALYGLAGVCQSEEKFAEAVAYYQQAIQRLESMRNEFQIEILRAAFLGDNLNIYRDLTALFIKQQQYASAFQVIERSKSRLITEKLGSRLTGEINIAVDSANDTVRALAMRLQSCLAELDTLYQRARLAALRNDPNDELAGQDAMTIVGLEHSIQDLIMRIQRNQPVFSPLSIGQTVALAQLQAELGEAIFLQYHTDGDKFGVFVIDHETIRTYLELASLQEVELANTDLRNAIGRVLASIQQIEPARLAPYLPSLLAAANKHLFRLYALLFQPLLSWLPAGRSLIISPDGLLHSIPFHAFYDGQNYLVEQFTMMYTPSATVFDFCTQQAPRNEAALLLGYDDGNLAAVTTEVQRLLQLYPAAHLALGEQATTATLRAYAPQSGLIHIAAHAAFRMDKPMLSTISLADRRLTLAEISRMQLHARLVGVSGCETGYGQVRGGDMLSLASSFLGAGARTLLASLWRVEDTSTAQLMERFHTATLQGMPYAAALRAAQLSLLDEGRHTKGAASLYAHPAFWAPFILLGA